MFRQTPLISSLAFAFCCTEPKYQPDMQAWGLLRSLLSTSLALGWHIAFQFPQPTQELSKALFTHVSPPSVSSFLGFSVCLLLTQLLSLTPGGFRVYTTKSFCSYHPGGNSSPESSRRTKQRQDPEQVAYDAIRQATHNHNSLGAKLILTPLNQ